MSDSEEDSSSSENTWPVNEEWLIGLLKEHYKTDADIKIIVSIALAKIIN